jgi:arylsulfatase A-like enzyme
VLERMDAQLAPLFDEIRRTPALRDNTLVLVCSDNGPEDGAGSAGPYRGTKVMLYEGGIRSPLVVWGPGFIPASRAGSWNRSSVLAAIDLAPSLLALAGVRPPDGVAFDGEALPRALAGDDGESRRGPLFFRRPPDRGAYYGVANLPDLAVRHGRWKLVCEYDGSGLELYDLDADPGESRDVAAAHPEEVARLRTSLLAWHQAMPPDRGATYRAPPAKGKKKG